MTPKPLDIDPHPEAKSRPGSGTTINTLSPSSASLPCKLSEAEMKRLVNKKVCF
ncbi:unnamed protein product [Dibothriocephalus latus]|uniref:Uncharacterized protein n=1 Tax=Dibothriocephalus latus TaxID=60516 RepID=A0A3P7MYG1_DIBLA|nr:unnamed protein product [Dibothriocephalus latus]